MFKLWEFNCENCSNVWEDLVEEKESSCPECKQLSTTTSLSINLGAFSMLSPAAKAESLKRRSAEHTHRELKKEPERFGQAGIDRAREGQIRSVGGIKKNTNDGK